MASDGVESPNESGVVGKDNVKMGEQHHDVEVGPEMVNIDRIEKVYA
jgi:hypothetical protein